MRHGWPARGGVPALALLAALGACSDSPVQPAATAAAGERLESGSFRAGDAFLTVSGGLGFTCGTTLDGGAYCWGDNSFGQLGSGGFEGRARPGAVDGLPAALAASAGAAHACALTPTGRVYCWGDNSRGQLGDGTFGTDGTPVRVQAPAGVRFVEVSTGAIHSCALAANGSAWCWGDNSLGQLGDGTATASPVPVRVQAPSGVRFTSLASGDGAAHTCALSTRRAAYCWGDNTFGQLGTGGTTPSAAPVRVQAGNVSFAAVAGSGFGHSCAISTTAEAYCWGDNAAGQLGDGTTVPRPVPTRVSGGRRYTSLVTGWYHSCAASLLSGAWCWGDNNAGKLGNGTSGTMSATPVAVVNGQGFGRMDPGADHSCSRRRDGRAYCWGQGFLGQLGDGASQDSPVPVRVADPSASSASAVPSFDRAERGGSSAPRGADAWCAARPDRGRIAACS